MLPAEITALLADTVPYRSTAVVSARRLSEPLDWPTDRGATLRAATGDWELTDDDGGRWTVSPEAFARSYRGRPDGRWAKHETVDAVRLTRAVRVPTREGASPAEAGDWLLRDAEGAVWPVPDDVFRERYRRAG